MTGSTTAAMPHCHRLFYALLPSAPARSRIAAERDGLPGARGRMRDERLHMTLLILDDLLAASPDIVATLRAVGGSVVAAAPEIALDRLVIAPGHAMLMPGARDPALIDLQRGLADAIVRAGLAVRTGWRFDPHVTLAFGRRAREDRAIAPIRWTARDFVLIDSHVGRGRYDVSGRWPLR